ncbi:hypothetical protein GGI20_003180 [Coemansia sp. BCRC 34301]|nr:hypothetical protein GGI20_003180 [Coemansia sp. BCRC 34301]
MPQCSQALSAADRAWAAHQVAAIIGATEQDAAPLADFLLGIESAAELQTQMLDMLGETPVALDFATALIAKRFPLPAELQQSPRQHLPQGRAWTLPDAAKGQGNAHASAQPAEPLPVEAPVQKSQRQQKKEKQQQERQQKEAQEKERRAASRKRVKCECQASEHALLTNCLTCGRIICDKEGPGPCMFCGTHVESLDQQLQQHMQHLLSRTGDSAGVKQQRSGSLAATPGARKALPNSYSMKAGGGLGTREAELLWSVDEAAAGSAPTPGPAVAELSEKEYLVLAFKALGIDSSDADPASVREAEAWIKATRRKERLLEFDRTAAQRTTLIDQASDFDPHALGKWMTPVEKAAAAQRAAAKLKEDEEREQRRRQGTRVLRLNFASGTVDLRRPDEADRDSGDSSPITDRPPANTAVVAPPRPSAAGGGPFAHNPLLGGKVEPRFVMSIGKLASAATEMSADSSSAKKLALRRQMLRIQTDASDSLLSS